MSVEFFMGLSLGVAPLAFAGGIFLAMKEVSKAQARKQEMVENTVARAFDFLEKRRKKGKSDE